MQQENPRNYIKLVFIVIAILLVSFGIWQGIELWTRRGKVLLTINAAPSDLTMFIGAKQYKRPDKLYLTPGKYSLFFERKDFSKYSKDVVLDLGKPVSVDVALFPINEEGRKFLEHNQREQLRLEEIGGRLDNEAEGKFVNKFPIARKLPYSEAVATRGGGSFRINYTPGIDKKGEPSIVINVTYTTDLAKKGAMDWLTKEGQDPNAAYINYSNDSATF